MGVTGILSSMGKCLSKNKHGDGGGQVLPGNIDPANKPMLKKSSSLGSFFSKSGADLEDGEEIGCLVANGYLSKSFINTRKRGVVDLKDPLILLYEHKIGPDVQPWYPMLEKAVMAHKPLLVIVGEGLEGEARNTLIGFNQQKGGLKWTTCAVRGPGVDAADRKKHFHDLGLMFGCQSISTEKEENIKKIGMPQLGTAKKIIVSSNSCVVKALDEKCFRDIEMRRVEIDELRRKSTDVDETQSLNERLQRLEDAIGLIASGTGRDELDSQGSSMRRGSSWRDKFPGRSKSALKFDEDGKIIKRKLTNTFIHAAGSYAKLIPEEEAPEVKKTRLVFNKELLGLQPGTTIETTLDAVKYGSLSDEQVLKDRIRMENDDGMDLRTDAQKAASGAKKK